MVKITVSGNESVTLTIEGRIAGPWIAELNKAWHSLAPSLKGRKLTVNLNGVTYIAPEAYQCLRDIHKQTGALFVGNSPLTSYFARELMKPTKNGTNGHAVGQNGEVM